VCVCIHGQKDNATDVFLVMAEVRPSSTGVWAMINDCGRCVGDEIERIICDLLNIIIWDW
jgi:hypothetical protein